MNISDGTSRWKMRDKREIALFDLLYPVGIIVSTTSSTSPFDLGEWEEVGQGRVLQGCNEEQIAGNTVEAGLPNITGKASASRGDLNALNEVLEGAFFGKLNTEGKTNMIYANSSKNKTAGLEYFDASKSNPIYGASETVQPPAYLVHFYRRTA